MAAIALSVVIGLLVALPAMTDKPWLRAINRTYVEIFRAIDPVILWCYYGLPILMGISLSPFVAGVIALALCDSAFQAEIFRAGIQSVERGQVGRPVIGAQLLKRMRFVILPQALRRILPALGNQFVYMLKMSSLVYVIGIPELTRRANELSVTVYRPLEIYSILVLEYLVLILVVSWLMRRLERRMRANEIHTGL